MHQAFNSPIRRGKQKLGERVINSPNGTTLCLLGRVEMFFNHPKRVSLKTVSREHQHLISELALTLEVWR